MFIEPYLPTGFGPAGRVSRDRAHSSRGNHAHLRKRRTPGAEGGIDAEGADPDGMRQALEVNVLGYPLCARRAIGDMTAGGAIVNISSAAATLGSPGTYVHYAAAKAAVDAMTVGLSKEVAADAIRVNCVAPGTIWTDFHADPQRPAKVAAATPMGRAGRPEEIAGAVAWLLSDDASYATGTVMRIAGGM